MTAWLKLAPTWAWWALALAVVAGGQQIRVSSAQSVAAGAQRELADYRAEVAERDRRAAMAAMQETKRRIEAQEAIERETEQKLADARADADSAGDALQRLQKQFELVTARSRACGNSITTQLGQAADSAARMQTDMFGRLGAAAQLYAGIADQRGIAGAACERAYDALGAVADR